MNAVQIIDDAKEFHVIEAETILAGCKCDIPRVVAILGPQSSGKSTLLNGVFGTSFEVMDEHNRKQTTHGIWAMRTPRSDIVVLDVEGTDGRERGEDQDFERKSALFSLAAAQVLIINIWANAVGLYHAANMSLLRTVMDVQSQIIDPTNKGKTILLFVVRDYVGETPEGNLSRVLLDDMTRIWQSIKRPTEESQSAFSDHFELRFRFLPHKVLQPEKFAEALIKLRVDFTEAQSPKYLFPPCPRDVVSCEDFAIYLAGIWERIKSNKDLDLPTERELLAQYRCDEIIHVLAQQFQESFLPCYKRVKSSNFIENLGGKIGSSISSAEDQFLTEASRYPVGIIERKRDELRERLVAAIHDLVSLQIDNYQKKSVELLHRLCEANGSLTIAGRLENAYAESWEFFSTGLTDSCPAVMTEKAVEATETAKSLLEHEIETASIEEIRKAFSKQKKVISKQLQSLKKVKLEGPKPSFWASFLSSLRPIVDSQNEFKENIFSGLPIIPETKLEQVESEIDVEFFEEITSALEEELSQNRHLERLLTFFDSRFLLDDASLPRIWTDAATVDFFYQKAKEETILVRDEILEGPEETEELVGILDMKDGVKLGEGATEFIKSNLGKHFERSYVEAKRSALGLQTKIPPWVFLLLLILGWNEMMAVLRSPFYLLLFLLALAIFLLVRFFNLSPVIQIAVDSVLKRAQMEARGITRHTKTD